jgi:hypothetical protein
MSLIIPANTLSGGYAVDNSLRFNDGSSDDLSRTPSSTGNRKTWTFSTWVKRSTLTNDKQCLLGSNNANSDAGYMQFRFQDGETLNLTGWTVDYFITNRVFRDLSAWYHILLAVDTTNGTAGNRIRLYVNGVEETSFSTNNNPSLNQDTPINVTSSVNYIGSEDGSSRYLDGYMAETVLIDGLQLDPTSFGEFDEDSGIWKPISVSGLTFGTNGFYLDFEDSAALGDDVSGNGNDFTVNNLTAIDQTTDTPTNNFNTWLPTDPRASNFTLSEGNLDVYRTGAFTGGIYAQTIMPSSGKWYAECKIYEQPSSDRGRVGIANFESIPGDMTTTPQSSSPSSVNAVEISFGLGDNVLFTINGSDTENNSFYSAFSNEDILRFALDLDNGKFYFGVNANWWDYSSAETGGDPTSGSGYVSNSSDLFNGSPICFYQGHSAGTSDTSAIKWNFGNAPYAISSGNTDGNGYGNFEYAVPSGYLSLCTANLSEVLG